jgi:hypothetical protein
MSHLSTICSQATGIVRSAYIDAVDGASGNQAFSFIGGDRQR